MGAHVLLNLLTHEMKYIWYLSQKVFFFLYFFILFIPTEK